MQGIIVNVDIPCFTYDFRVDIIFHVYAGEPAVQGNVPLLLLLNVLLYTSMQQRAGILYLICTVANLTGLAIVLGGLFMALSQHWSDMRLSFSTPYALILGKDGEPLYMRFCHGTLNNDGWAGARISCSDKGFHSPEVKNYLCYGILPSYLGVLSWDNQVVKKANVVLYRNNEYMLLINEQGIIFECENINGIPYFLGDAMAITSGESLLRWHESEDLNKQMTEFAVYDYMDLHKNPQDILECVLNAQTVILPDELYHADIKLDSSVETLVLPREMSYCHLFADYTSLQELAMPEVIHGTAFLGLNNISIQDLKFNVGLQYHTSVWVSYCTALREIDIGIASDKSVPTQFENIYMIDNCPSLSRVRIPINAVGYNYIAVYDCPNLSRVELVTDGTIPSSAALTTNSDNDCEFVIVPQRFE